MLYKEYSYAIFTIILVIRQNICVNADRNYICVKGKSAGTVSMYENIKFHKILNIGHMIDDNLMNTEIIFV